MIYVALLLINFAQAEWFFPYEKSNSHTVYPDKGRCENDEGVECFSVTSCPVEECAVQIVDGRKQLVRIPSKVADHEAAKASEAARRKEPAARRQRIKQACPNAEGLIKDLCEEMLDGR